MKKNLIYIVLLAALGIIAFVPGVKEMFMPVAEIEEAVKVNEEDYDIALEGLNTPDANLEDFRGKKLLFLNFWGTWCAPCREEWPTIEALYKDRKEEMDFVLIAMLDEKEAVLKFMKENGYTAPVYLAKSPVSGKILPKVYPTTFILDKTGRILQKETATKDWNSVESNEFIDNMLK